MADLQEDLLKRCNRNTIRLDVEQGKVIVELSEEVLEQMSVFSRDLNCHFALDLSQLKHLRAKFLLHVRHNLVIDRWATLDDGHDIAHTKAAL